MVMVSAFALMNAAARQTRGTGAAFSIIACFTSYDLWKFERSVWILVVHPSHNMTHIKQ